MRFISQISMMDRLSFPPVYELEITLLGIKPPIWRAFVVQGSTNLYQLHKIIQVVMGWDDSHCHDFRFGKIHYGRPDPSLGDSVRDEAEFTLAEVSRKKGAKFYYEYDFGDCWEHEIKVKKIETNKEYKHPQCLDGSRNCPPEDIGGVWRYMDVLESIKNSNRANINDISHLIAEDFDPEEFNIERINKRLMSY
jgi:hypothetical protein